MAAMEDQVPLNRLIHDIAVSMAVSAASIVVVLLVGRLTYHVTLPWALPGFLITVVVAAAVYCCLAFALAALVPSASAAAAPTNLIALPVYFMSGLFARNDIIPEGVETVADVLPVKPLFETLVLVFDPTTTGVGVSWGNLLVLVAWGAGGLLVALRFFRRQPAGE